MKSKGDVGDSGNLFSSQPFRPHRLFPSGHLQTVIAAYVSAPAANNATQRHLVPLGDGDTIVLHDDVPQGWQSGSRIALLIHGVAGCHGSPYLVRTARKLNEANIRTFRMDLRGMGAGRDLARFPGHAGRSDDVRQVLAFVRECSPVSPISIIGFSMGGNLVLKLLGEASEGLPANCDSGLAVAPPVDLAMCCRRLSIGLNRIYSRAFTRMLLKQLAERKEPLDGFDPSTFSPPKSLWDFDDRITAPLSGFRDAPDYYQQSSSSPLIAKIAVPTTIVFSKDDPLIPIEMFADLRLSSAVDLVAIPGGGHVGYFVRGRDPDRWWLDWRIVEWVEKQ